MEHHHPRLAVHAAALLGLAILAAAAGGQTSYQSPGGLQLSTPFVDASGNVCTRISNSTAQSQTVGVKYVQATQYSLLAAVPGATVFGETMPANQTVPAHGSVTVCFPPFVGGLSCNGFKICDIVNGNTIAFCAYSGLNPPAPPPPPPPLPATESFSYALNVEYGVPNPATDVNVDVTFAAPAGWTVTVPSSFPVPPVGTSMLLPIQVTRPTNQCGVVRLHFTFTGAALPFTTIDLALTAVNPTPGTTGTPGVNDATIDGIGSGMQSLVPLNLAAGPQTLAWQITAAPDAPTIGAIAPLGAPGAIPIGSCLNSLDLNVASGLSVLWDGLTPSTLSPFLRTLPDGTFALAVGSNLAPGPLFAWQGAIVDPFYPLGLALTQAFDIQVVSDPNLVPGAGAPCNPSGFPLALTDDSFVQVPLGFGFPYYGAVYNDAFVGSNGFVTFVAGSTDFTETVFDLLTQPPRIAVFWDDLNPGTGGTVSFFTDNFGQAELCFTQVPEFGTTNASSFLCRFGPGLINNDYGAMAAVDGLVGCSPGFSLDPIGTALNLSIGPNTGWAPGAAVYQLFTAASPNDLAGFQLFWTLDAFGNPISQN